MLRTSCTPDLSQRPAWHMKMTFRCGHGLIWALWIRTVVARCRYWAWQLYSLTAKPDQ